MSEHFSTGLLVRHSPGHMKCLVSWAYHLASLLLICMLLMSSLMERGGPDPFVPLGFQRESELFVMYSSSLTRFVV